MLNDMNERYNKKIDELNYKNTSLEREKQDALEQVRLCRFGCDFQWLGLYKFYSTCIMCNYLCIYSLWLTIILSND